MKEIILRIPDEKVDFVLELIEELGLERAEDLDIPEEHKKIILERIRKSKENPERLLAWEDVKDSFRVE